MIICRKPITLYDVDVLGAVGVVVLSVAIWWLVVVPWQQTLRRHGETVAQRTAAQARLQADLAASEQFAEEMAQVERAVATQTALVPRSDSLSRLLSELTELAKESRLELLSVAPQPAISEGAYLVSDIQVSGRGQARDFVQFLDQMASNNPYQTLRGCSISRPANNPQATCDLTWTVRLYLLPQLAGVSDGGKP